MASNRYSLVIGFTVLRGALRRKSIVENNINQTVASGINTASAGVVFTLPALLLLSVDDPSLGDFPIGPLIFSAIAGSLMGIVLIIPLRKFTSQNPCVALSSTRSVPRCCRRHLEIICEVYWLAKNSLVSFPTSLAILRFVYKSVS